jgi:hypothetical protein
MRKLKKEIYEKYPKHSAYRSGLLVQEYKRRGGTYIGNKNEKEGLARWMKEKWTNQRGEVGYKYKSDVYRPTVKVTDKTPTTFNELTNKQIERARQEKAKTGRVKKFLTN